METVSEDLSSYTRQTRLQRESGVMEVRVHSGEFAFWVDVGLKLSGWLHMVCLFQRRS